MRTSPLGASSRFFLVLLTFFASSFSIFLSRFVPISSFWAIATTPLIGPCALASFFRLPFSLGFFFLYFGLCLESPLHSLDSQLVWALMGLSPQPLLLFVSFCRPTTEVSFTRALFFSFALAKFFFCSSFSLPHIIQALFRLVLSIRVTSRLTC